MTTNPILVFWLAFGISAIFAFPIYKALIAVKSRQTIDSFAPEGHQKKQGTPTMGGLVILIGWLPALFITQHDYGMIIAVVGFMLIGFIDDFVVPRLVKGKRGLGWKQKILMQLLVAVGAANLSTDLNPSWLWIGIGAFLILFFSNAFNFADGLDGLAGGIIVVLCLGMVAVSQSSALVSLALIASTIPFLYLNAPPAKIFMGDVGSLPIGAFLGLGFAQGIRAAFDPGQANWWVVAAVIVMNVVLILELVLVPIQVGYYKRTKKRIFPATPIHHAFEVKGWPESRIVWTFVLTQVVCVALGWTIAMQGEAVAREARISQTLEVGK